MKKILFFLMGFVISSTVFSQTYIGNTVVNSANNMEVSVVVDPVLSTIEITMTGPINVFRGYGFGGSAMSTTYAIITDGNGNVEERKLGNHNSGTVLTSSLTSTSHSVTGSIATTIVTRPLTGMNSDYYTFLSGASTVPIIWAFGQSATLSQHTGANRGISTLIISQDCSTSNTASTIDASACELYFSPSGSQVWFISGTYMDVIPNSIGCDSVITINLSINSNDTVIDVVECASYTSPSGDVWNVSGTYEDTIQNSFGCDSVIKINLTINNTASSMAVETCDAFYTSPSGNNIWAVDGIYTDVMPNASGCDSIITIDLSFVDYVYVNTTEFACLSFTSPSGNYVWTTPGIYIDTVINSNSCDTIFEIDLNIGFLDVSVTPNNNFLIADNVSNGVTYQWLDCDKNFDVIPGATDQIFEVVALIGNYAVEISLNGCVDTSDCFLVDFNSVDNYNGLNTNIYPNPTSGSVFVQLLGNDSEYKVSLLSVSGQLILESEYSNKDIVELDLEIEPGIYILQIRTKEGLVKNSRIIKH